MTAVGVVNFVGPKNVRFAVLGPCDAGMWFVCMGGVWSVLGLVSCDNGLNVCVLFWLLWFSIRIKDVLRVIFVILLIGVFIRRLLIVILCVGTCRWWGLTWVRVVCRCRLLCSCVRVWRRRWGWRGLPVWVVIRCRRLRVSIRLRASVGM